MEIEKAKQEFLEYTKNYDVEHPTIARKIGHSIRVMENSKKIAESLKLNKEQIEIATLIGLLHDIGRFEQVRKYDTTKDQKSIDHGDLGAEILETDEYIRKYIEEEKYDNLILEAIKNHNKFKIEESLTEEEMLFAKIIRDADKLDIFYEGAEMFWKKQEEIKEVETSRISEIMLNGFRKNLQEDRGVRKTLIDNLIGFIAMIFDINFKYDFQILKKEDYINTIINKFNFKDEETKEQIEEIRKIANEYIERKGNE